MKVMHVKKNIGTAGQDFVTKRKTLNFKEKQALYVRTQLQRVQVQFEYV